jgi:hypothetical protein
MQRLPAISGVEMTLRVGPAPIACASIAVAAATCGLALASCGSSSKPGTPSASNGYADFLNFSKCMRSHGVTGFPDPSAHGGIELTPGSGLNPQSPAFQSAQQSCKHLLPGGGPPANVPESTKLQLLRQAECMRTHGVPNFPDPTFLKGGAIGRGLPPGINPSSHAFQNALKACGGGQVRVGG